MVMVAWAVVPTIPIFIAHKRLVLLVYIPLVLVEQVPTVAEEAVLPLMLRGDAVVVLMNDPWDRRVLDQLRFLTQRRLIDEPKTLEDLSHEYGISRERVRQIEVRAFEKLQKAIRNAAARIAGQNPVLESAKA